ncbi:hypothetical protein [uncultured Oscillibacter sp.]|uniref:hypothetical protein n=1 Tax=uncultured Oscillibacter sp. TaxID=876091 RepID=UPI0026256A9A|nr:hypothetical protein [uncultured Oscillibacter sp.]
MTNAGKAGVREEKERICSIRKMSGTIIPFEEERDFYNLSGNVPFDDRFSHEADMVDLSLTLIRAYLKEVRSSWHEESGHMDVLDLRQGMDIVNTLPEYTKPKNAGLMTETRRTARETLRIRRQELPPADGGSNMSGPFLRIRRKSVTIEARYRNGVPPGPSKGR